MSALDAAVRSGRARNRDADRGAADTGERRTPTALHWGAYDVVVRDGRVVALEPSADDPDPSPIGAGMAGALDGPVRITEPMVREGWLRDGPGPAGGGRGSEPFVAVSWDRAYAMVADELRRVHDEHGPQAVYGGSYGWGSAGRLHHAQSQLHRFLALAGGYTASVGSYSAAALEAIMPRVIGGDPWSIWTRGTRWPEIAEHGELVVSFGGMGRKNAQANAGGVGAHESVAWQRRCRERGVRFVNVSPVRDDVADDLEPAWLPIRPGTDAALLLALCREIAAAGLHDREFLERCCSGADELLDDLAGGRDGVVKDADWAAPICELPADAIRSLAREIATLRTTINLSWSIQRQRHGEQAYWAGVALAAFSGSLGRPGGGLASGLGISQIGVRGDRPGVAAFPPARNPVAAGLPVARIADALLHPGAPFTHDGAEGAYPDLRLVYWAGGNPFHHHQDLGRLVRAWQRPDTVVVHDAFWNPLCRHADVVLPVALALERDDLAIGMMDLRLTAMHRAVDPPAGVPTDHAAFSAIAERLGFGDAFTEGRDEQEWLEVMYERTRRSLADTGVELPAFPEFRAAGGVTLPDPGHEPPMSFAALRRGEPLDTPSGRIELASPTIAGFGLEDCPGRPTWLEPEEWLGAPGTDGMLHLLSNQPATRLHSQFDHGGCSREAKVRDREPVRIHPADAAERGIADGDVVRLHNDRGACLAGAVLDDALRRGVVVLATGAWYDPEVPGGLDRHGNPNVLTADRGSSGLAQGPTSGNALVRLERFDGEPPPVRAFEPPAVLRDPAG